MAGMQIELTHGQIAFVDLDDYKELSQFKWYKSVNGYAVRTVQRNNKKRIISMHREVLHTPVDKKTDHINGDKLDNRKINLRICTDAENMLNRLPQTNNTSGYVGVSLYKRTNRWHAYIKINHKNIHLGYFSSPQEAAVAHDQKAQELGFMRGNFYGI